MEINKIYNVDCIDFMKKMDDDFVDLTLTDIPYDMVNRKSNGLRNLDKGEADILSFDLETFLNNVYRVTRSTSIIFCGINQVSEIFNFFFEKQRNNRGTVRQIIWQKTNPSPMNGQHIYLSGIENAVWFKKRGGTFNAHCKNTVFKTPAGRSKNHPTEKNHLLLEELIKDNSNDGDLVFDPCCGSGSHLLVAKKNNRKYLGCEINKQWYDLSIKQIEIM
jgi:DNA modification methylase